MGVLFHRPYDERLEENIVNAFGTKNCTKKSKNSEKFLILQISKGKLNAEYPLA